MNNKFIKSICQLFLLSLLLISACKKDKSADEPKDEECGNTKQTATSDRVELTNDSIFLYAKQIYYWNDELPCYDQFEPRQYTSGSNLTKYENNLLAIAQSTQEKYDVYTYQDNSGNTLYTNKFSYIEDVSNANGISAGVKNLSSSVNLQGKGNDIGIYDISAYGPSDNDFELFIKAVSPGSPAAQAGLTRGTLITKIGSETIGDDWDTDIQSINLLFNDPSSVHLEGKKADSTAYSVNLEKKAYTSSPIYKDTILSISGKNIGYLAYARFSDSDNSEEALDDVFQKFSIKNIEDLVVDLRYNGGGYVTTAAYLANLIVPNGTSGTMFTEYYTQSLQDGQVDILKNQPVRNSKGDIVGTSTYADYDYTPNGQGNTTKFSKKGNLSGVKNIVFLVTANTASASELLINSLRAVPSLTVKLVGTTTYGKPVGFFPVRLEGIYDLYLPSFTTKNANNEGDYYKGFTPGDEISGKNMVDEMGQDLDNFSVYDFGDKKESYLAEALNQLGVNTTISTASRIMSIRSNQNNQNAPINLLKNKPEKKVFKGMIETRIGN
ncbi:S41 family peptidase [Olivibacter ginsenosidimutans]|uniref:S41 family peptidase n=1 Tax=Olivibacter ginsenosidimutans TaxID=1176537 RepID=A0ABP9B0E5_9SPHI